MTAHDQMRAMLDQLMGTARNGEFFTLTPSPTWSHKIEKKILRFLGEPQYAIKFSDNKVCKSFLVGCCPHDILATTVSTLISPSIRSSGSLGKKSYSLSFEHPPISLSLSLFP